MLRWNIVLKLLFNSYNIYLANYKKDKAPIVRQKTTSISETEKSLKNATLKQW